MAERVRRRSQKEGERPSSPFDQVAKALLDYSRKTGKPLNEEVLSDTFSLAGHETIMVSLNTAFVDETGRPRFTIINTYASGLHSHQVAMLSDWNGDEPATEVDQARVGERRKYFKMDDLAKVALKMIERRLEPPVVVFPQVNSGRLN